MPYKHCGLQQPDGKQRYRKIQHRVVKWKDFSVSLRIGKPKLVFSVCIQIVLDCLSTCSSSSYPSEKDILTKAALPSAKSLWHHAQAPSMWHSTELKPPDESFNVPKLRLFYTQLLLSWHNQSGLHRSISGWRGKHLSGSTSTTKSSRSSPPRLLPLSKDQQSRWTSKKSSHLFNKLCKQTLSLSKRRKWETKSKRFFSPVRLLLLFSSVLCSKVRRKSFKEQ